MASGIRVLAENEIEATAVREAEAFAAARDALVDQAIEYRILIGEQRDMIRSMVEFARLMMVHARETLARADQILERNAEGGSGFAPANSSASANRHPIIPPLSVPALKVPFIGLRQLHRSA